MKEENPITEEVKKVAEETGAQVENVAEGSISKKKMDSMDSALDMGAKMLIKSLETIDIKLTEEQEDVIRHAYQASFAVAVLMMK